MYFLIILKIFQLNNYVLSIHKIVIWVNFQLDIIRKTEIMLRVRLSLKTYRLDIIIINNFKVAYDHK